MQAMLTTQRKQHLLALLHRDGQLIAKDVSASLVLSEDTIRRDLRELSQEGKLQRVHGGALPASPAIADFAGRESITPEGKIAIGRMAAGMIAPGQVVILDGGTTARQVARHIPLDLRATLVTHSPTIALELINHAADVILIGGRLFKHSVVAVGAPAIEAIAQIRADLFFLGVTGVHAKTGLTTGDYEEAAIKRALAQSAAETWVLASSEKLGAASAYTVLPIEDIAGILTDKSADKKLLRPFEKRNIQILQA